MEQTKKEDCNLMSEFVWMDSHPRQTLFVLCIRDILFVLCKERSPHLDNVG